MPKKLCKKDRAILSDLAFWEDLSDLITGWKVDGFTRQIHCIYETGDGEDTISMSASQRDDLMRAIRRK
jgi:hypothetical protein